MAVATFLHVVFTSVCRPASTRKLLADALIQRRRQAGRRAAEPGVRAIFVGHGRGQQVHVCAHCAICMKVSCGHIRRIRRHLSLAVRFRSTFHRRGCATLMTQPIHQFNTRKITCLRPKRKSRRLRYSRSLLLRFCIRPIRQRSTCTRSSCKTTQPEDASTAMLKEGFIL